MAIKTAITALFILLGIVAQSQDAFQLNKGLPLSEKFFNVLDKKAAAVDGRLTKQTDNYLSKLQRRERRLKKKLQRKDSTLATQLFGDIDNRYAQLRNRTEQLSTKTSVYSGHLDSLTTALSFLKNTQPAGLQNNAALERSLSQLKGLQESLNQTEQVKRFLRERQGLLKQEFQRLGMIKELKGFRKDVYYYQAQVNSYKEAFEDPEKLEVKLMEIVTKIPAFKDFFVHNSQLGSLFSVPGTTVSTTSLAGLQTRAGLQQLLVDRFGTGPTITQALQQNVRAAQGQLNELKNKVSKYSDGSLGTANDTDLPDFRVNSQKTRSFLQRIEIGTNLQTQRARSFFPTTSDIGLSLGYRLNDRSILGVGASYKIGLGTGWDKIKFSNQGAGIRSFLDYKLKHSLWISGGYELNYRTVFHSLDQLKNLAAWQKSALIGLSKKYTISKKLKGDIKLLWDFLSYQQMPRTQPVIFRIGYSIK